MTLKNNTKLGDLFSGLGLIGDHSVHQNISISRIASAEEATAGDLVFVAQASYLLALKNKSPSAIVVSESLLSKTKELQLTFPVLPVKDAMLAFAKTSAFFTSEPSATRSVHASAVVHPSVRLGNNISIGAFVQIDEGAQICDGAILHARVSVGARATIGKDCVLFPGVVIYQDTQLGNRVRIHANSVIGADGFGYVQEKHPRGVKHVKIHHLGRVRIGDDVEIGASTTIDRGTLGETVIGDGCIIDNQVQIGHNCQIGEGVIICGCTGLAGSAKVEKFALLAGMVAVNNKVTIGAGAKIAGCTGVFRDVPAGTSWEGIPMRPIIENKRLQVYLNRLPELFGKRKKEKENEV